MSDPRTPAATIIGLDLGKRRDWTALAIVQKFWVPCPVPDEPETKRVQGVDDVPFLDRVQNESYELIADRMAALKGRPGHCESIVVIDGTASGPRSATCSKPASSGRTGSRSRAARRRHTRDCGIRWRRATIVAIMLESRRLRIGKALPLAKVLAATGEVVSERPLDADAP